MKINTISLIVLVIATFILSACRNQDVQIPSDGDYMLMEDTPDTVDLPDQLLPESSESPKSTDDIDQNQYVAINTDHGQVVIELFSQQAPNTVKNFMDKVNSNYYDGLIFHRVVPGFVVQGGDPTGTGTGGGKIDSELNQIPFKTGNLGLARTPDTKEVSNDSQFFICLTDEQCSPLTGDYVNFGQVISGMDVVRKIKIGDKINSIVATTK